MSGIKGEERVCSSLRATSSCSFEGFQRFPFCSRAQALPQGVPHSSEEGFGTSLKSKSQPQNHLLLPASHQAAFEALPEEMGELLSSISLGEHSADTTASPGLWDVWESKISSHLPASSCP